MNLVEATYRTTTALPAEEKYGLSSQMRRAAVSIPSNIAEGQGRRTDGEFLNCLSVAHGSVRELETQVMLALRLRFVDLRAHDALLADCAEVGRLVNGLMNTISNS